MNRLICKIFVFCFFFLLSFFITVSSQGQTEKNFREKIYFGGNFGLQIGTIIQIEISPRIGYRFTERFSSGVGIMYQYYKDRRPPPNNFRTNIYGGNVFASYIIYENIFAHTEYELLSLETDVFDMLDKHPGTDRFLYSIVLVGGGYRRPIRERSFVNFMVLWNLNDSSNSPYTNPVIRIGFTF